LNDASLEDEHLIHIYRDQLAEIETEGMQGCLEEPLSNLLNIYIALGDEGNTVKYGLMYARWSATSGREYAAHTLGNLDYHRSASHWNAKRLGVKIARINGFDLPRIVLPQHEQVAADGTSDHDPKVYLLLNLWNCQVTNS
jgi:hypothetical protein